ncbi:TetR/AcrR family transcriptional regulator [Paenibacillus pasadenensis]|uniref:TetR/AcrR family transcriptional regulator n=1 Tax=Paenibacillus pasadenensis TaxID=217090 RepID=UPI000415741B|nr:TetR family transcriptional regulator [Paenibacillus pasadenensis]
MSKVDVRVRMLRAAKKLFAKHGFEKTTIRQICEEACANVALVSYHFGGKDGVFAAIFNEYFPDRDIKSLKPGPDPEADLKVIIREMTLFRRREPELISIIQQEMALRSPRRQIIQSHKSLLQVRLRECLERGRAEGRFRFRSLDTTQLFVMGALLAHTSMIDMNGVPEVERMSAEEIAEHLTAFILAAVRGLPEAEGR